MEAFIGERVGVEPSRSVLTMESSITTRMGAEMLGRDRWEQIRALGAGGMSVSEIGRRLGLDRKTVRYWLKNEWRPYGRMAKEETLLTPHRNWLLRRVVEVEYSARVLYQELRARGYRGSYETVKRFVAPHRTLAESAAVCQTRFETAPGEQAQVDYGQVAARFRSGVRRMHIFVMTLGYSRRGSHVGNADERVGSFLEAHEHSFERFGGVPKVIVYDRARIVWLPAQAEQAGRWNPTFKRFADHWGYEPWLCRAYRAQTKGKVESGVKYVKRNFMPGRSFIDVVDFQEQLEEWQNTIADLRIHGTVHERPIDRFKAERAALAPIAGQRPFAEAIDVSRVVADDYLISYDTNRYSVPYTLIGKTVHVRRIGDEIVIHHNNKEVARHGLLAARHQMRILPEHGPGAIARNKRHRVSAKTERLLNRWLGPAEVQVRDLSTYEEVTL